MIDFYRKIIPTAAVTALVMVLALVAASCDIAEDRSRCGDFLEFRFDYNMEFEDLFTPQVGRVDVYIFDAGGKFVLHKGAAATSLTGGNRMLLEDGLPHGTYTLLTVGGLADPFAFTDLDGDALTVGQTAMEDVMLALVRSGDVFPDEFATLWFSDPVAIDYRGNRTVWPVGLIRNTNGFEITLVSNADFEPGAGTDSPYTFEIVTPEGAAYGYDNRPLLDEILTFTSYHLARGTEGRIVSTGSLNTMRLLYDLAGYRLIVRDAPTGIEMWSYDLMPLLAASKPASRPDGTPLPMQEYLDRQGVWEITLNVDLPDPTVGFTAVSVVVNGWIVWLNDIGIE